MMPLHRQPAPGFWADKECAYRKKSPDVSAKKALSGWQHEKQKLSWWFHRDVRPADEPRACAYCDARLKESSPETIDHFLPESVFPELGLSWQNLYPACTLCNSSYKGARWSGYLLRPDVDLLAENTDGAGLDAFMRWFDFEPDSGRLNPAPCLEAVMKARVRLTIGVFKLNEPECCKARQRLWRTLLNAAKDPSDELSLEEMATQGPYRFVALFFLARRKSVVNVMAK